MKNTGLQILFVPVIIGLSVLVCQEAFAQRMKLPQDFYRRYFQREIEETRHTSSEPGTSGPKSESILDASDQAITTGSDPESEIHAAINPTDSSNIVVSAMRNGSGGLTLSYPIYYSKDFGKSWKLSSFQPGPFEPDAYTPNGGDPMFCFDADGKLYYMWMSGYYLNNNGEVNYYGLYWATSTDGGATWQRDTTDVIGWNTDSTYWKLRIYDKEWMAADRFQTPWHNTIYASFSNVDSSHTEVQLLRKRPGDTRFDTTATLSSPDLAFAQWTTIGVDRAGGVHVVFTGTFDTIHYGLYHVVSHDGGATFSAQKLVSPVHLWWPPRPAAEENLVGVRQVVSYPCSHLLVDSTRDGNLYLVWSSTGRDTNEQHGEQIYFCRSTDYGQTWSPATILTDDGTMRFTDHYYPSIAVSGSGILSVSWYDRRDDPNNLLTHYYCTASSDGGLTWSRNAKVTSVPTDFSTVGKKNLDFCIGEYTQLLASAHLSIPIWSDGRTQDGALKIYCAFQDPLAKASVSVTPITDQFTLLSVTPNPTTSRISATYRLEQPGTTTLEVTDATGRVLRGTSDRFSSAGEHVSTLELEGISSGEYFLRITSQFGYAVRAFTLLK